MTRILTLAALTLALGGPRRAAAQLLPTCSTGSERELREAMQEHARQTTYLDEKLLHVTYGAAPRHEVPDVDLHDLYHHLNALEPRRPAVLFQALAFDRRLCTWLILRGRFVFHSAPVDPEALRSLRARLLDALGIPELLHGRSPVLRGVSVPRRERSPQAAQEVLRDAARLLLPDEVARELVGREIDTLVLVPSSDIGAFPFAALPVEGRPLIERASIVVAPGFDALVRPSVATPRPFDRAVIVGNPVYPRDRDYVLPDLPGAEAEAQDVARLVSGKALLRRDATLARVRALLSRPDRPAHLVYLATHGIADIQNPLDGSKLWLDARWSPREMSRLPLSRGHPLVVLSACQTALGKTFSVGTIGFARAWVRAGASRVVMSLWRVDDDATRALMTRFLELAKGQAVERALQQAMIETRARFPDEARWASFAVMGVPEPPLQAGGDRHPPSP